MSLPSRVGLGGGGACVLNKRRTRTVEALDFLPRTSTRGGHVPGLARGMAALHARYGALPWPQLVAPAERLARLGNAVSRAFRKDLAAGGDRLVGQRVRAALLGTGGALPREGDELRLLELSATLSGLRRQGAGYIYAGPFAERLVAGAEAAGRPFSKRELQSYGARFREPLRVAYDSHDLSLPPVAGGFVAALLWKLAVEADAEDMEPGERARFLAEASLRTAGERDRWIAGDSGIRVRPGQVLDEERIERLLAGFDAEPRAPTGHLRPPSRVSAATPPSAGIVAADRYGNLVACGFTMNGLFGAGRTAHGTGVLLAGDPGPGEGGIDMAPAVIANRHTGKGYGAFAAGGGSAGQAALVQVLLQLRAGEAELDGAVAAPRLVHAGEDETVLHEPALPATVKRALHRRGHRLEERRGLGRLAAIYCPNALPSSPEDCRAVVDPRGHGLAERTQ